MFSRGAIFNLIIGLTIALLPFFVRFTIFDFSRTSKDNLMVIILMVAAIFAPPVSRKMGWLVKVCLTYFFIIAMFNHHYVISINVMFQSFYIASALMFFALVYERLDRKTEHYLFYGMMAGALFQVVFCLADFYNFNLYGKIVHSFWPYLQVYTVKLHVAGTLGNSNLAGAYLAITSMAFLITGRYWLFIIPAIATLMTESLMGIGALISGTVYFALLRGGFFKEKIMFFVASLGMAIAYFTGLNGEDHERFATWKKVFDRMTYDGNWLFGGGPGWMADQKIINAYGETMVQEHGEFIALLDTFGLVGFALFLAVIFFKKGSFGKWSPVLFVSFVNSFGHFGLHQSTVAIIILLSLALCLSEGEENVINMERIGPTN